MIKLIDIIGLNLARYFTAQIVNSLAYLHSKNIVHRDLKPANIVLNENFQIQLTDLGTAKAMITSQVSSNSGTSDVSYISGLSNISALPGMKQGTSSPALSQNGPSEATSLEELVGSEQYISPEMLISRSYTYASDIWALGIIVFQFFVGKTPFKGKTQEQTFELIKECKVEVPDSVPEVAKDFIQRILRKNPEDRLGAQHIQDLMNHQFFNGINFETVSSEMPPEQLDLTQEQQALKKYLPKYKVMQRSFVEQPKTNSYMNFTQLELTTQPKSENFVFQSPKHEECKEHQYSDDSLIEGDSVASPSYRQTKSLTPTNEMVQGTFSQQLRKNQIPVDGHTPNFTVDRTLTANFGAHDDLMHINLNGRKSTIMDIQDIKQVTVEAKPVTEAAEESTDAPAESSDNILYQTIVKKKNFFYNQRQIMIYSDGSFSYSRKGNKQQKQRMNPKDISHVERNKQYLTIFTSDKLKQLQFKFASQAEARQWQIVFNAFI